VSLCIAYALEEFINQNGLKFLTDEPYQVYTKLIESRDIDRKTAAALLHVLVSRVLETRFRV